MLLSRMNKIDECKDKVAVLVPVSTERDRQNLKTREENAAIVGLISLGARTAISCKGLQEVREVIVIPIEDPDATNVVRAEERRPKTFSFNEVRDEHVQRYRVKAFESSAGEIRREIVGNVDHR